MTFARARLDNSRDPATRENAFAAIVIANTLPLIDLSSLLYAHRRTFADLFFYGFHVPTPKFSAKTDIFGRNSVR